MTRRIPLGCLPVLSRRVAMGAPGALDESPPAMDAHAIDAESPRGL